MLMTLRLFMAIVFLIVASCTAHTFILLDDMIVGFSRLHVADVISATDGASEYFQSAHWNNIASMYLYFLNVSLFITSVYCC